METSAIPELERAGQRAERDVTAAAAKFKRRRWVVDVLICGLLLAAAGAVGWSWYKGDLKRDAWSKALYLELILLPFLLLSFVTPAVAIEEAPLENESYLWKAQTGHALVALGALQAFLILVAALPHMLLVAYRNSQNKQGSSPGERSASKEGLASQRPARLPPGPAPQIHAASEPDGPFLERLDAACVEVCRVANSKVLPHGFRMASADASGDGADAADATRALRSLVLRYPAHLEQIQERLAGHGLEFLDTPLRAGKSLDWAVENWVERDWTAADSVLYSELGAWVWPGSAYLALVTAIIYGIVAIFSTELRWKQATIGFAGMIALGTSTLLFAHRWRLAQSFLLASSVIFGFVLTIEGFLRLADRMHVESSIDVGIESPLSSLVWAVGWPAMCFTSVFWPRRTVAIMIGGTAICHNFTTVLFALIHVWHAQDAAAAAALCGVGTHIWLERALSVKENTLRRRADQRRREEAWLAVRDAPQEALWRAWSQGQDQEGDPKYQVAKRFSALYKQADELNELVQAKVHEHCAATGGRHVWCDVKDEQRALQKCFRSYRGEWRRLTDLVRTTAEFADFGHMASFLLALAQDPEVEVVKTHDGKMRLRRDACSLGGYRDVQLSIRLKSKAAVWRGVDHHVAEVQLHLADLRQLQTASGHQTYIVARNLHS